MRFPIRKYFRYNNTSWDGMNIIQPRPSKLRRGCASIQRTERDTEQNGEKMDMNQIKKRSNQVNPYERTQKEYTIQGKKK